MSQWTHVTGSIRFHSYGWISDYKRNVKKVISNSFKKNIPTGSEGPLEFKIFQTGYQDEHGGSIEWGSICFFANLRDYDSKTEIYEWIVNSCKSLEKESVRDMAVLIDVESRGRYFIYLDSEFDEKTSQYIDNFVMKKLEEE